MLRYRPPIAVTIVACLALFGVAVGGAAAAGLLTGKDIKNNSLRSVDIRNRTLLKKDFRKGQLPRGAKGAMGPAGATGKTGATGPAGVSGLVYVAGGEEGGEPGVGAFVGAGEKGEVQADCPSGTYPISGTLRTAVGSETGLADIHVGYSEPTGEGNRPTGWHALVFNDGTEDIGLEVLVACVPSAQVPALPASPEFPTDN